MLQNCGVICCTICYNLAINDVKDAYFEQT